MSQNNSPVDACFKYFFWTVVAIVLLAVVSSSVGRRVGSFIQAEFRAALQEQR